MNGVRALLLGWKGYAAIAVIVAVSSFGTAWTVRGWKADRDLNHINMIVARQEAARERKRADEAAAAAAKLEATQRQADAIRAERDAERDRHERETTRLLQELHNAPTSDTRELGPAVLRLLDSLRH